MPLTKPQGDMLMKLGTQQASTSGTSIDFTGLPKGITQIFITFDAVSTNGASDVLVQLGDAGGVETTGYVSRATRHHTTGNGVGTSTAGFHTDTIGSAATSRIGTITLTLMNPATNKWVFNTNQTVTDYSAVGTGTKSLSEVLDRVRITTVNGTDTFDAGSINIAYF